MLNTRKVDKCAKKYCAKLKRETIKLRKNMYNNANKKGIKIHRLSKKEIDIFDKKDDAACMAQWCNPGCKGTIFENGKNLTKEPLRIPYQEEIRKKLSKQRRELFGKKESILKDDFYEKLSDEGVAKSKKRGAISGCLYYY